MERYIYIFERFGLSVESGQVTFRQDKYIYKDYLSWDKLIFIIFPHPRILFFFFQVK